MLYSSGYMSMPPGSDKFTNKHAKTILRLVSWAVSFSGLFIIGSVLVEQVGFRHLALHLDAAIFGVPLLLGLSLVYLGMLLLRQKRTAWFITVGLYSFSVLSDLPQEIFLIIHNREMTAVLRVLRGVILPGIIVTALIVYRRLFTVRSDLRSFTISLRSVALVLAIALVYGTAGFILLEQRDFHREISLPQAVHYTVDQFNLTTDAVLQPYSRRAVVFMDSLTIISFGSLFYVFVALFQPLRARLSDQSNNRALARRLLHQYPASSEDFFKLWPYDKTYIFGDAHESGVAFEVRGGVALAVGDVLGDPVHHQDAMDTYLDLCRGNDWLPTLIHTLPSASDFYKKNGFSLQKIGEEAVVDTTHFLQEVRRKKYFRQIENKFAKQHFSCELLLPPHDPGVIAALRQVSDDWLALPGRSERGFMMGYFSAAYMQQCPVMIVRDGAGVIQAFVNQIPSFDSDEANFDLLRYGKQSPGNINDFLLMNFIQHVHEQGFARLNLGLCPLAGLSNNADDERTVIGSALQFLYANGDRLYSFSGLHRFKAKYEPVWQSRYIAYRGGIRGFTRTLSALNKAMKVAPRKLKSTL